MIDIKEVVDSFFERYVEYFDREHDLTLEKECYEDWDEDWAIFFAFPKELRCEDDILSFADEHDVADLLRKEFEGDPSVRVVVREKTHEIEVYREGTEDG